MTTIVVKTRTVLSNGNIKYSLTTSGGNSLRSIFIRPAVGVDLVSWSFVDVLPQERQNRTYFVSIANGVDTEKFSFDLVVNSFGRKDLPMLEVSLVSVKYDLELDYTEDFKKVLNRFPDWANVVDCVASVTSYIF